MFPEILWKRSVVASHRDASGRRIIAFQCAAENEKCVFVTPSQALWNFFACWRLRWEIVGIICRKSNRKKWHQVLSCIKKVCFWLVFHFSTLFPPALVAEFVLQKIFFVLEVQSIWIKFSLLASPSSALELRFEWKRHQVHHPDRKG